MRVDRRRLAVALGFSGACENSLDAVGGRDWVSEVLFAWTQTAIDLTRLAEDLIIYSSTEFALIRVADDYSTGSSLMPQKRNPDGAELAPQSDAAIPLVLLGFRGAHPAAPATTGGEETPCTRPWPSASTMAPSSVRAPERAMRCSMTSESEDVRKIEPSRSRSARMRAALIRLPLWLTAISPR